LQQSLLAAERTAEFRKSSVPISECVLSRCVMSGRPHRSTEKPGTGNSSGHRRRATQVDGKGRLVHSRFWPRRSTSSDVYSKC